MRARPRVPGVGAVLGNSSPNVRAWICAADAQVFLVKATGHKLAVGIKGRYEAEYIFSRAALPFDLSNRIKALEDWLQRVELIENDKYCERLVAEWGRAPLGVRVRLRGWMREERPS